MQNTKILGGAEAVQHVRPLTAAARANGRTAGARAIAHTPPEAANDGEDERQSR